MTLTYSLDENDYVIYQLYIASNNDRIKEQRIRTWLTLAGSALLLSFCFYMSQNKMLTYYFLFLGLIALCYYPFYQRRYYRKHYQKIIHETYKSKFGQVSTLSINDKNIECFSNTSETKINLSEIEQIDETTGYFYIKMRGLGHFIISKNKIENVDAVKLELQELSEKLEIEFISNMTWKWK